MAERTSGDTALYPQIAIVTVCRNALPLMAVTLDSVCRQRYPRKHFIVVDGASTDGTLEYLQKRADAINILISEPDRGIYDAMNKAVEVCASDSWVIFLNAGDQFGDDNILMNIGGLLSEQLDFLVGDVLIENPNGARRVPCHLNRRYEMPACHQAMLCRASVLKRLEFDRNFAVGADFDFFVRATLGAKIKRIAAYPGVIAQVAPQGYSASNECGLRRDYFRTIARHKGKLAAYEWLLLRHIRRFFSAWITMIQRLGR